MESEVKCTLCGSKEIEFIPNRIRNDVDGEFKMYRCASCDTHFLYPKPLQEELEEYYDGNFRKEVHSQQYYDYEYLDGVFARFTPEAKLRVARISKELNKEDTVLEIGCSVGYFLDAIAEKVSVVYGTEWDKKAQQYMKDCSTHSNILVSDNPQDFNCKFDKIFMFHVLEHIEDPVTFLENLKPLLNPKGKIYIEVPNVDDILVKTYECNAFKDYYYKKAHLYNLNEKGLKYIFNRAGYQFKFDFIQRYDISNHLFWLGKGIPKGQARYAYILGNAVNDEYVTALKESKQTDTIFATIWL